MQQSWDIAHECLFGERHAPRYEPEASDILSQLQEPRMHEPIVPDMPGVSRRELQLARALWKGLGASAPEGIAGNRKGEA